AAADLAAVGHELAGVGLPAHAGRHCGHLGVGADLATVAVSPVVPGDARAERLAAAAIQPDQLPPAVGGDRRAGPRGHLRVPGSRPVSWIMLAFYVCLYRPEEWRRRAHEPTEQARGQTPPSPLEGEGSGTKCRG